MPKFWIAIALGLTILAFGCTPVEEPSQANQNAASTDAEVPTDGFESLDRGAGVTVQQATYGGYADTALEDALSYATQGDEAALSELLDGDNPDAIAFPADTSLRFEGCYYGDEAEGCRLAWVRVDGSTDKWVVQREDLAINR